jgi:ABC-type sugar transport system ATPase subunit
MPHLRRLSRGGWLTQRRIDRRTVDASRKMKVKAPTVSSQVRTLSGGNQQKVIFARWLLRQPRLYILDEPTRGIDVGAKSEIYEEMGKIAYAGNGVLVVSSSLPELLGICDRIVVMRQGRVVGEVRAADSSEDELLSMAMGVEFSDDARN